MPSDAKLAEPEDNVATAIRALSAGDRISLRTNGESHEIELRENIPFGHKFALEPIAEREDVVKYGTEVGVATADIRPGEHVHVHNVRSQYSG